MSRGDRYPSEGFDGSPFFLGKKSKTTKSGENNPDPGRRPLNERHNLLGDEDDEIVIEEADSSSSTRGQPSRKRPAVDVQQIPEQPNSINRTKGTFFDYRGDAEVQALNKAVMSIVDPEGKNKNNQRVQQESAANIAEKREKVLAAPKKNKNGRLQMRGWNFGDLAGDFRAATGSSVVREVKQVVSVESSSQSDSGQAPTSRFFGNKRVGTGKRPPVAMGMTTDGGGRDQKGAGGLKAENPTLKNFDDNIISLIESEIMHTHTNTGWSDVAGLESAKKALREIVVLPFKRPDIFKGIRAPPKGVLLFGPPGTGKTMIGKCVASQSQATFFNISASSLTSKWVGEGEKLVRALFAVARIKLPSVIFIDEIDSLLSSRSESEHESSRRIKTEFLVQLDGVATKSDERLLVLGATNRPYELDEAARRRFAKRLYIALPEAEARLRIVENLLKGMENSLAPRDYEEIGKLTEGYSGADMRQLCSEAAMGPIREIDSMEEANIETVLAEQIRPINGGDFVAAARNVRATVEQKDLDVYRKWDKQFGCLL